MDIMRQCACLLVNQIMVYSYGVSLIARRWVRPQTTITKTFIDGLVLDAFLSLLNLKFSLALTTVKPVLVGWLVLLLYVPSQQLWSLRDGQLT